MNVNKGYFYFSKRCFACQKYLFTRRNKTANNNSFGLLGRDGVQKLFFAIKYTPKLFSQTIKPLTTGTTKGSHSQLYFLRCPAMVNSYSMPQEQRG